MQISFHAQSQPHIAALALRLETHEKGELTVIADSDGIQLTLQRADGSDTSSQTIQLTGRPLPGRQTVRLGREDGTYELKVPMEPKEVGLDVLEVPVSAGELSARRVRMARCKRCRNVVWDVRALDDDDGESNDDSDASLRRKIARHVSTAPKCKPYTFRALPSAHWHESSEAWLCHPSGEFTTKLQRYVEKGWWPGWRVGLVGERAVAVRVRHRSGQGMEPSLTDWQPLTCPRSSCNAVLGTRNIRTITAEEDAQDPSDGDQCDEMSHGGERVAETWRLDKYAVHFIDRDEGEISCQVDEILAAEMLEHAQSLGVRKFRLADEVTGEECILLWLFTPDTEITWGTVKVDPASGESTRHVRSGRFATILWQDLEHANSTSSERYEVLSYPSSAVDALRAILAGDGDGVPRNGRKLGDWRWGCIRR